MDQFFCGFPGDTFICYGNSVFEGFVVSIAVLPAFKQIAFKHESYNTGIALDPLVQYTFKNKGLSLELLS